MRLEALYQDVVNRYFIPSFRTIAISYCVSIGSFYDTIHDYTYADEIDSGQYERTDAARKSYRHLRIIMERLASAEGNAGQDNGTDKLFRPTVFDRKLPQLMVDEYNHVAESLGTILAPQSYSCMLKDRSMCLSPESSGSRMYAFPELVVIACLCCALQSSSLDVLNNPMTTDNERKRARGRFRKIKSVLDSPLFYNAVVKTFFDMLPDMHMERHAQSLKAYCKIEANIEREYYKKYYRNRQDVELGAATTEYLSQQEYLRSSSFFFGCVCPVAELITFKAVPMDLLGPEYDHLESVDLDSDEHGEIDLFPYVSTAKMLSEGTKEQVNSLGEYKVGIGEYLVSREVAKLVGRYLRQVFDDVVDLLECLPETSGLSKKPFQDYFRNL